MNVSRAQNPNSIYWIPILCGRFSLSCGVRNGRSFFWFAYAAHNRLRGIAKLCSVAGDMYWSNQTNVLGEESVNLLEQLECIWHSYFDTNPYSLPCYVNCRLEFGIGLLYWWKRWIDRLLSPRYQNDKPPYYPTLLLDQHRREPHWTVVRYIK